MPTMAALVLLALIPATRSSAERVTGNHVVIIDGDTISILGERIRLMDIDAPETAKPRCEAELVRGLQAKELLRNLLRTADSIQLDRAARPDRYGRTLARLLIDGRSVGDTMIRRGLAVRWEGGAAAYERRLQIWCLQ